MTLLLCSAALLIIVLYLLLRPIWWSQAEDDRVADPVLADLYAQKELLYNNIREMEADRRVGKFSNDDFQRFSKQSKEKAAAVLRQIDAYQQGIFLPGLDEAIETAIGAKRSVSLVGVSRVCSQCGAPLQPGDRFCGQCGAPVRREAT